jgi:hypothetical protein
VKKMQQVILLLNNMGLFSDSIQIALSLHPQKRINLINNINHV